MAGAIALRLNTIRERGGIRGRDIARLLGTTPETVSRWQTGKVEPQRDSLHRLLTLEWLLQELSEFYNPSEARLWLFAPHKLLGGESPAERIEKGKVDDVIALIEQLKDGGYA